MSNRVSTTDAASPDPVALAGRGFGHRASQARSTKYGGCILGLLALTIALAGCGSVATPSIATTAQPTLAAVATGSPTVDPAPSPPEIGTSPGVCGDGPARPSILAGLDPATRLACHGATTLNFEARLVLVEADIDYVPFEMPSVFEPVWVGDGSHPVFIADIGTSGAVVTESLPLRLLDASTLASTLLGGTRVRIDGHFDDPASLQCRRPTSVSDFPEVTDEEAIEFCRAQFIATSISPPG